MQTVRVLTSWISSVCERELIILSRETYDVDSSSNHKVTSSIIVIIIILKIDAPPTQSLGTTIFNPWKESKTWGKQPPSPLRVWRMSHWHQWHHARQRPAPAPPTFPPINLLCNAGAGIASNSLQVWRRLVSKLQNCPKPQHLRPSPTQWLIFHTG